MNAQTKSDLKEFITAVENLAHELSNVCDRNVAADVYVAADRLRLQLDKDETIVKVD